MSVTILEVVAGALSDFDRWMKEASTGDLLVYWRGDLQYDRQVVIDESDRARSDLRKTINTLNAIADRVRVGAKAGELLLTQKRLGKDLFEYRATRVRIYPEAGQPSVLHDDLVPA